MKPKVAAKKWLWWYCRVMAKDLLTTIHLKLSPCSDCTFIYRLFGAEITCFCNNDNNTAEECVEVSWVVCWVIWTYVAELSAGWPDFSWTVLLEYLDRAFSISTCFYLFNSVIVDPILLSFGKSSLWWLIHFSALFFCDLSDSDKTLNFSVCKYQSCDLYKDRVLLHISVVFWLIFF